MLTPQPHRTTNSFVQYESTRCRFYIYLKKKTNIQPNLHLEIATNTTHRSPRGFEANIYFFPNLNRHATSLVPTPATPTAYVTDRWKSAEISIGT